MSSSPVQVFAFSPAWGLPSTGPFALKLLAWLRIAQIPHEIRTEDDTRKGPKGKNPWIEHEGVRMGDSQLILEHLSKRFEVDLDAGLSAEQRAQGHAIRMLVEEHLHQVFEWELMIHDAGYQWFRAQMAEQIPVLGGLLAGYIRGHFRKQLTARGIARHTPAEIERMGRADVDALSALLGDKRWFLGDRPSTVDCAVWGLLSPAVFATFDAPVCRYAKSVPNLSAWTLRVRDELFPECVAEAVAA